MPSGHLVRARPRKLKWLAALALAVVVSVLGASALVEQRYAERIVRAADAPEAPVALVFGAGLESGREPSPVLAERLDAAVALYQAHKVQALLLSGDGSDRHHEETKAMRRYARDRGVPDEALLEDPAGISTYDTCARAAQVYGVKRALLVTQEFHLPRALYIAHAVGIDAWGIAADEGRPGRSPYELRELLLSRPLALVMVALRPEPTKR
jgi:SanA protein